MDGPPTIPRPRTFRSRDELLAYCDQVYLDNRRFWISKLLLLDIDIDDLTALLDWQADSYRAFVAAVESEDRDALERAARKLADADH